VASVDAAIILTGGRARRLGGTSKPDLVVDGRTLLATTIAACQAQGARLVVTVGPDNGRDNGDGSFCPTRDNGDGSSCPATQPSGSGPVPPALLTTREDPPFSGPARAVAAGVATLSHYALARASVAEPAHHGEAASPAPVSGAPDPTARIAVLACDMPHVGAALPLLAQAMTDRSVLAVTGARPRRAQDAHPKNSDSPMSTIVHSTVTPGRGSGRLEDDHHEHIHWLLGIHPWSALVEACSTLTPDGTGESMRHLWSPLHPQLVGVPEAAATDIDTWPDLPGPTSF